MLRGSSFAPAPSGHKWHFHWSIGVDCSNAEPQCIWLAVLRGVSNPISPCTAAITPTRRTSSKIINHQHLSWAKSWNNDKNRYNQLPSAEMESISSKGPQTIVLQKNSQGFGFTLRHFIVYPPESTFHSLKEEENGNIPGKVECQRSCLEPMDTIFVKSVKENGPAQQAGLCTGDRLVKVNRESILGKTYSEVITLIQNSENLLELTIMPKTEDVLQLVYSHNVNSKGSTLYLGEAQKLTEPPHLCTTATTASSTLRQPTSSPPGHLDNWPCRGSSTVSPLDNQIPATSRSGQPRAPEDSSSNFAPLWRHQGRASAALDVFDFHFSNHNAAITSATLPPPPPPPRRRRSSQLATSCTHSDALCHLALSDWYYSQAQATEHSPPHYCSISQDYFAESELCSTPSPGTRSGLTTSADHHRKESFLHHYRAAAAVHESSWLRVYGSGSRAATKSCSESLQAAYAEYEHNYGRSVETLAEATALVSQNYEQALPNSSITNKREQRSKKTPGGREHKTAVTTITASPMVSLSHIQLGRQVAEPQKRRLEEQELVGYKSSSPSFYHKEGHLPQQANSFREHISPQLYWGQGARRDNDEGTLFCLQSTPIPMSPEEKMNQPRENREVITSVFPFTHQLSIPADSTPTETLVPSGWTPAAETIPISQEMGSSCRVNGSLAHTFNSLSSIPFIGSIKSRRSSYLLAITTERSKSCDEGLNTYREESSVFSKLPKRVKSFFTDGSLDSLRAQEDAPSKRHSTSELGTVTFSQVHKEGWLYHKQILTEKGKKVGGSMRPWKRAFSVLHHHSLFLYKDKREAVLRGSEAGSSHDEHPPVNIRGCLIDIAYSETKRKHTLRLTTQDFCEYLLQAEDRNDMLSWIRVIRENSKTDNEEIGFSRQALINKKLNDYRKHSLTGTKLESSTRTHRLVPDFLQAKSGNTSVGRASRNDDYKALWGINLMKKTKKTDCPKAFGVRLEDCQPAVNYKFVPLIVEMCCNVVENTGLEYTGIYRVPGNNAMVSSLQEHLSKGMDINTAEERWQDLNVISSLLKSFLRKLPEPLFTDDKYNDFIDANRIEDAEDRLKTMKKLICDLPDYYYHTLKFLVGHLKRVADHSEKNKMEPRNLALVFGPTLVRTSEDNMTDMVTHMPDRYKIVETLILHHDWFFCDGKLDQEEKAPEDKGDIQPVPNIDHLLSNIGRPGMPGEASDSTTSNSVKPKMSSSSKKDLNSRNFLSKSIISDVTRKRKKCLSTHLQVSSSEEESGDVVKDTSYRVGNAGQTQEPAQEEHACSKKEKRQGEEHEVTSTEGKGGEEEIEKPVRKGDNREIWKGSSCVCYPQQNNPTYPKPPAAISPPSDMKVELGAKKRPNIPFWIAPSRLPTMQISSCYGTQQLDQTQVVSLRCRKNRGSRIRANSINLELGRCEDIVRGQRADRGGEVLAVPCGYIHQGLVVDAGSAKNIDPLPIFPSPSGWIDKSSQRSDSVVLRRSARDSQAKTRVLRRHTVVI
ncbi:rho GTPase-activating protein 23 isoform X2 [Fundulus heteroclitus]|uniref:rho GTPase-activating protein 23 isoform X2 n=1 Tax=Fundulus heteroclitus TaxID=8078 RepID=UPI00165A257C|nr:rho GTPase-activating protein 23 isoform X2 [Fundulus heteroclitus]